MDFKMVHKNNWYNEGMHICVVTKCIGRHSFCASQIKKSAKLR